MEVPLASQSGRTDDGSSDPNDSSEASDQEDDVEVNSILFLGSQSVQAGNIGQAVSQCSQAVQSGSQAGRQAGRQAGYRPGYPYEPIRNRSS